MVKVRRRVVRVAGRGRRREQEEPRGEGDPSRRHNVLCGVCVLCVCVARVVRVCVCVYCACVLRGAEENDQERDQRRSETKVARAGGDGEEVNG
jgi:hypothetical protein